MHNHLKEKRLIWEKSEKRMSEELKDWTSDHDFFHEDSTTRTRYIPPGLHRVPFTFILPEECPHSVPNLTPGSADNCEYAFTNYKIKASVDR